MARIEYQYIREAIAAELDAEGSEHYTDAQDYIPAINKAMEWICAAIGARYGEARFSEKALVYLLRNGIWQTNKYGRFKLDDSTNPNYRTPNPVWDIFSIICEPRIVPAGAGPIVLPDYESRYRFNLSYAGGGKPCKRLSGEQVTEGEFNTFAAGSKTLQNTAFRSYSYSVVGTIDGRQPPQGAYDAAHWEVQLGPEALTANALVAVTYCLAPEHVDNTSVTLPFPEAVADLLIAKAGSYISIKQGDGTSQFGVSEALTAQLYNLVGI